MTLYAKWIKNTVETYYTVTFNSNGGSSVSSQSVKKGEKLNQPADPTRSGYIFMGWYKNSSLTQAWNFATDVVNSDITLYAKWEESNEIPIDEAHFPDENFRESISNRIDKDKNGMLSESELEVTEIYVSFRGISNLKGIEYFTKLTDLKCNGNQLSNLDLRKNTVLKKLDCGFNQFNTLDVSKNTTLEELDCYSNQLSNLDVSKNTALKKLICGSNQLSNLDVSKNTTIMVLYCGGNQLSNLDVSKNTVLKWLICSSNQLSNLDVSKNTGLTVLYCDSNQLSNLDVSKNTALLGLHCSDNNLTSLNVSENTSLTGLYCYRNDYKYVDISTLDLKELNYRSDKNDPVALDKKNKRLVFAGDPDVISVKEKTSYTFDKKVSKIKVSKKKVLKVKKKGNKVIIEGKKTGYTYVTAYGKKGEILDFWAVEVK